MIYEIKILLKYTDIFNIHIHGYRPFLYDATEIEYIIYMVIYSVLFKYCYHIEHILIILANIHIIYIYITKVRP